MCVSVCQFLQYGKTHAQMTLYAEHDIKEAEELTIRYYNFSLHEPATTPAQRSKLLEFDCICHACLNDLPVHKDSPLHATTPHGQRMRNYIVLSTMSIKQRLAEFNSPISPAYDIAPLFLQACHDTLIPWVKGCQDVHDDNTSQALDALHDKVLALLDFLDNHAQSNPQDATDINALKAKLSSW